jgi:O-antigen/teichoic acid export membrane protein
MIRPAALLHRHRGVAIGIVAQVLQYGAALLLLPFIVTRLSAAEVGIWYVFVTIQSLATLADFGFLPTIARAVAAGYAGAAELRREGLADARDTEVNLPLVKSVVAAARQLYFGLSLVVGLVLATAGLAYVTAIADAHTLELRHIQTAWLLFAAGTAANLYFLWLDPLLIGAGRVPQTYLLTIISRGGFALLGIAVLLAGGGLVALAMANLVSIVIARLIAVAMIRPIVRPLASIELAHEHRRDVLKALWPNASKMGMVAIGAFLINRANLLVVSGIVGLGPSASYALSVQILGAIGAVAQLPTQVALPQLIAARVQRDRARFRSLFVTRQAFLLIAFAGGALFMILAGQWLLATIGSHVQLLPQSLFLLLAVVQLLELNHSNCATIITTANRVPFVKPALLSGVAVVALSVVSARAGLAVTGVILSQGLVQLAYNNWKWPLMLWKEAHE